MAKTDYDKIVAGGGTSTSIYTAAETVTINLVAAIDASGEAVVASKDDSDRIEVIGFFTESKITAQEVTVQKVTILDGFTGLIPGEPVYLGNDSRS